MEKQTKILIILVIIIILGLLIVSIFILNNPITSNIIKEQKNTTNLNTHMYTKALCNETNFCQDYEITCQGNQTKSISPITGAVIQHTQGWQDPRSEEQREKLC